MRRPDAPSYGGGPVQPPRKPPAFRPAPPPPPPVWEGEAPLPVDNLLLGRNPIREALKAGRSIEKLLVAKGDLTGTALVIVAMAREAGIVVQTVERDRLDRIAPNHQGLIAYASAYEYQTIEAMLEKAAKKGEAPLLVVLDSVTDPHNLGAIIRSADCVGAHGVIVAERRAAGLTPAAVKASAGAIEHVPVAKVVNLSRTLDELKALGLWIVAADTSGVSMRQAHLKGPVAVVIGAEGEGISRLVLEHCDIKAAIPMAGQIGSLNASVAAGVLLYEIHRQREGE